MPMPPPIVYYHAGCPDGALAAVIARDALSGFSTPLMVPARYDETVPADYDDRNVWMVDFSFPRDTVLDMLARARTVTILDHHQPATSNLTDLMAATRDPDRPVLHGVLDESRSGAGITWDYLHPGERRPHLVDLVEDRDLWRFRFGDETREIAACVASHDLGDLDAIAELLYCGDIYQMRSEGYGIERFRQRIIDAAVEGAYETTIAGYKVLAANCPYAVGSDVAGILAKGRPFGAYWLRRGDSVQWGLRSTPDGLDVAQIAETFGGGGHRHASGFRTSSAPDVPAWLALD